MFIIPTSQMKKVRHQGRQGLVAVLAGTLVRIEIGVNSLTLGWCLPSVALCEGT